MSSFYEPREDSYLLLKQVKKISKGVVLDIGTGSGVQALGAAKKKSVKKVVAVDIDKEAIEHCKKNIKKKTKTRKNSKNFLCPKNSEGIFMKIKFIQSDLFSNVKLKFDTIIFNPPYLPEDVKVKDLTLDGGKKGYETIERFLNEVNDYLKTDGVVLIVFSSLTKKEKIDEIILNNMLEFKQLDKRHIFFEDLYVYLIKKTKILKELEKRKIKNIKKLTKGHRGLIYTGYINNKKVTVKIKNPESKAVDRIKNEAEYLKLLNKYKIGPKLLFFSNDYFVYEFIKGEFIERYIKKAKKKNIIKIIKNIFNQMFIMDKLKINKEEMHHPVKHVIVSNNKPYLIDFERCHKTLKPHNVTQFCQYIIKLSKLLKEKNIKIDKNKIIGLSKKYKKDMSKENLKLILKLFC